MKYKKEYSLGADVSFWQGKIDFKKMKETGIKFVFIRASQGTYADNKFRINRAGAKEAGLLRGYYHFLVWQISGKQQAKFFWNLVKDDIGELPLVVDFETNPSKVTPVRTAKILLRDFLEELKRLSGQEIGIYSHNEDTLIYSGAFFLKDNMGNDPYFSDNYSLWIGSYTDERYMEKNVKVWTPWDKWKFWQFTDRGMGTFHGVSSKQLDMNYYNGDIEADYGNNKIEKPIPPIEEPDVPTIPSNKYWKEVYEAIADATAQLEEIKQLLAKIKANK